jgi:hypothetical protein
MMGAFGRKKAQKAQKLIPIAGHNGNFSFPRQMNHSFGNPPRSPFHILRLVRLFAAIPSASLPRPEPRLPPAGSAAASPGEAKPQIINRRERKERRKNAGRLLCFFRVRTIGQASRYIFTLNDPPRPTFHLFQSGKGFSFGELNKILIILLHIFQILNVITTFM